MKALKQIASTIGLAALVLVFQNCGELGAKGPSSSNGSISPASLSSIEGASALTAQVANSLASSGIVKVTDFGAVGNGVVDDTQAFIDAIAAGRTVIVPRPAVAYRVGTIPITKPVTIIGESGTKLVSGTETVFFIESKTELLSVQGERGVEISHLTIDMSNSRADTAAIFISDYIFLYDIRISHVAVDSAYHFIRDTRREELPPVYNKWGYIGLHIEDVAASRARNTQISLNQGLGYTYIRRAHLTSGATIDQPLVEIPQPATPFPMIRLWNDEGAILEDITIAGSWGDGIDIRGSFQTWMDRLSISRLGGTGVKIVGTVDPHDKNYHLNRTTITDVDKDGVFVSNALYFSSHQLVVTRAKGHGVRLQSASTSQFSELTSTYSGVNGLWLDNSSGAAFSNLALYNNGQFGIAATGSSSSIVIKGFDARNNIAGPTALAKSVASISLAWQPKHVQTLSREYVKSRMSVFRMSDFLSKSSVANVIAFGAKGDGNADDTDAFNRALAFGGTVVVPWTPNGYKISGTIVIRKPVDLVSTGRVRIKSGEPTLFWIAASNVRISGFRLDLSAARTGTTAFHIDSSTAPREDIAISDIWTDFARSVVANTGAVHSVSHLSVEHVTSWQGRGSDIQLTGIGYSTFRNIRINRAVTLAGDVPAFKLVSSDSSLIEDVNIEGGNKLGLQTSPYLVLYDVKRAYLYRVTVDAGSAHGLWVELSRDLYLDTIIGHGNQLGQIAFIKSSNIRGFDLLTSGAGSQQKYGTWIQDSSSIELTNFRWVGMGIAPLRYAGKNTGIVFRNPIGL